MTDCRESGDLVLISHALDAIYDIFAEDYYDKVLKEH